MHLFRLDVMENMGNGMELISTLLTRKSTVFNIPLPGVNNILVTKQIGFLPDYLI